CGACEGCVSCCGPPGLNAGRTLGAVTGGMMPVHTPVHPLTGGDVKPRPPTAKASVAPSVNVSRAWLPRPGRMPEPKQIGAGMPKSLKHCVGMLLMSFASVGATSCGTGTCGTVPSSEITRPPTDDSPLAPSRIFVGVAAVMVMP